MTQWLLQRMWQPPKSNMSAINITYSLAKRWRAIHIVIGACEPYQVPFTFVSSVISLFIHRMLNCQWRSDIGILYAYLFSFHMAFSNVFFASFTAVVSVTTLKRLNDVFAFDVFPFLIPLNIKGMCTPSSVISNIKEIAVLVGIQCPLDTNVRKWRSNFSEECVTDLLHVMKSFSAFIDHAR